jgi:GntR family transcriptional regulator, transcriptional repressor for pyruvate dehydrogenase complex
MPIQTVESHRLYRQIADQLAKLIEGGEFKPGQRLPPERNLAQQLGVSRPSVREALIALEVEGYVEVRVGSGVYVTNNGKGIGRPMPLPANSGPFEVMHARRIIESECAALAAKEATRNQIRTIEDAYEAMIKEERNPNAIPLAADRLFHLRIAEASGNSALALTVKTLWDQRVGPLFMQLEHHFTNPETWTAALTEHRDVVDAIVKRDAKAARATMRLHLDKATRRFNKSFGGRG